MNPDELLTYDEAAKVVKMHPVTLRRFASEGRLKTVSFGRAIRIRRGDLMAMGVAS